MGVRGMCPGHRKRQKPPAPGPEAAAAVVSRSGEKTEVLGAVAENYPAGIEFEPGKIANDGNRYATEVLSMGG